MDIWKLPTSLNLNGVDFAIRSDFRAILDILQVFEDPEYEQDERWYIMLDILYEDFEHMPEDLYQEAGIKAIEFIDMGAKNDGKRTAKLMDWTQDAPLIIPAVNKVLNTEIRALPYMHWWTFIGAYQEIGQGTLSTVINIRNKKAKGQKLDKDEKEYYRENKSLIDIKPKLTEEEQEAKDALNALLG